MKLLFDQNISYRIVGLISNKFSDAEHINQVDLKDATEKTIIQLSPLTRITMI